MITILFGESSSGKDTFLKKAVEKGFKPIISYTTRPMRENEKDGVDYNFVSRAQFEKLNEKGKIAEYRSYKTKVAGKDDTWFYGSPKVNANDNWVAVVDMTGIYQYIKIYGVENLRLIYIHTHILHS